MNFFLKSLRFVVSDTNTQLAHKETNHYPIEIFFFRRFCLLSARWLKVALQKLWNILRKVFGNYMHPPCLFMLIQKDNLHSSGKYSSWGYLRCSWHKFRKWSTAPCGFITVNACLLFPEFCFVFFIFPTFNKQREIY